MKQNHATIQSGMRARSSHGHSGPARLEAEITELKEENDLLRRQLEEVELRAEFRATAHRLLAIPFSPYE